MGTLIKIGMALSTIVAIGAFVAAFAAHVLLQFQIDHSRVRGETGEPGWKLFGSVLAPVEFYKDEAKIVWKIQRTGLKVFAISVGVIVGLLLCGTALGVSVE